MDASSTLVTADELSVALVRNLTHQDVLDIYDCNHPGACMDLFDQFMDMPSWRCNTEANHNVGGSWIGHVLPGVVFLVWATHWMLATFHSFFDSKAKNQPYRSRGCHSLPGLSWSWRIEAWCKVALPPVAISMELYLAHCDWREGKCQYRNLYCPQRDLAHVVDSPKSMEFIDDATVARLVSEQLGTAWTGDRQNWGTTWDVANWRAGHIDGGHVNNWQHASMYPAFVVSGIIDLLAPQVDAPAGTQQVFLALSFLVEAMLMGLHKKHTPLDRIVHEVLFYTMMATAVFTVAEAAYPRSFLMSCGRIASAYLQSIWFLAAARIVFEGHPAWDVGGPNSGSKWKNDLNPSLYAPILFTAMSAVVPLVLVGFYAFMQRLHGQGHMHGPGGVPVSVPASDKLDCEGLEGRGSMFERRCMPGAHDHFDVGVHTSPGSGSWLTGSTGSKSEDDMDDADLAGQVLPVRAHISVRMHG